MKKILLGVLVVNMLLGVSVGIASATSTGMKNVKGYNWLIKPVAYPEKTYLTIYNNGLVLVKEVYEVKLDKGKNEIWFGYFPDQVDPASIRIKSLTAPDDLVVLEQSFVKNRTTSFRPISKSLVASVENKYTWTPKYERKNRALTGKKYHFTKNHQIELSYFVRGIDWQVKYRLEINKSKDVFNFSGHVVITNQSGNPVEYKNAKIKLVAGDVHQAGGRFYALREDKATASQFEEKTFFEYHTYTLNKYVTLKWNETKLIPLFSEISSKLPRSSETSSVFQKKLIFEGQRSNKVQIWLNFLNSKDKGLGILPAGVVQVFKQDIYGQLEFIGEDRIDHTPKGEMVNLYIGNAFDIVGERKVLERKQVDVRTREETVEIILKNHKDENVEVIVIEHLPYIDWHIMDVKIKRGIGVPLPMTDLNENLPQKINYKKRDAQTIEFRPLVVPKNSRTIIIYKIRYIKA